MQKTIFDVQNNVIGWVRDCFGPNAACKRAAREGRTYHAIPRGTHLESNHFASEADAIAALHAAQKGN